MSLAFSLRNTINEISRARRIAEVLVRNGLDFLVEMVGLTRFLPPWRTRRLSQDVQAVGLSVPQRVRRTLEELGPTYIKLGQILSTRPDILPQVYVVELSKLLDDAPPVPATVITQIVEAELHRPLSRAYASFDPDPIASASIGQVHRAVLHDGTPVVVKVQRPGIKETIEADLHLLLAQARFLESRSETLAGYGLVDLANEFSLALRNELDYALEGRNVDRLRELVAHEDVVIPKVYWDLTTPRVLTLSDLQGIQVVDREELERQGFELAKIAEQIVRIYLKMVFVHGVFHADPHPANILVCDGRIGLVDFGVVGYLTSRMRRDLGDLLFALVQCSAEDIVHVIQHMGAAGPHADRDGLQRDIERMLVRYYNVSLESVPIAQFLGEVMAVSFRHHVRLPSDLALLARTVVVLEGVARSLDPSLVLAQYLEPFVVQVFRERFSLRGAALQAVNTLRDLEDVAHRLPRRVDEISRQLERGEMTFGIDVRHLNVAMRKLDAIANRLAFSIIVAAVIIGSALILLGGEEAARFRIPFTQLSLPIPQIGFVVAAFLGAWLLFSIIRSRGL